jgi:hypothetical protein
MNFFAQTALELLSSPLALGSPVAGEHTTRSNCWLRWDLTNFLPELASNCNPPDLSLPSS